MRGRSAKLLLVLAAGVGLATVRCYSATEIVLEVLTDVEPCGRGSTKAAIYMGSDVAPSAQTEECRPNGGAEKSMGTLVLVPSGDRDSRAIVRVTLSTNPLVQPEGCEAAKKEPEGAARTQTLSQCAFASRKVTYSPHRSLRVPIRLLKDCLGVVCADEKTCVVGGQCVDDGTECLDGTCEPPLDGGPPDAGDGGRDGGNLGLCSGPTGNGIFAQGFPTQYAASESTLYWANGGNVVSSMEKSTKSTAVNALPMPGAVLALAAFGPDAWALVSSPAVGSGQVLVRLDNLTNVVALPTPVASIFATTASTMYMTIDGGVIEHVHAPPGTRPFGISPPPSDAVIVADATHVFLAEPNNVRVFARSDPKTQLLTIPPAKTRLVAAVSDQAYGGVTDNSVLGGNTIHELDPVDGGGRTLSAGMRFRTIAVDEGFVYWGGPRSGGRTIQRAARGSAPTPDTTYDHPDVDAVDFLAVDLPAAANRCVYFWSSAMSGGLARTLRVIPKSAFKPSAVSVDGGAFPQQ